MTYTKEQLEAMSNFEVNNAIFKTIGGRGLYQEGSAGGLVFDNGTVIDYCNNWSDIMPLAVEHDVTYKIGMRPGGGGASYTAENFDGDVFTDWEQTPQRAIACCLLMMEL